MLIPDLAERRNNLLVHPGVFVSENRKEGFDCLYCLQRCAEGLEQLTKTENAGRLPVTDHGRLTV